ncbi:restriction endonuclease subunit S [Streptobacillus moniliformis]|uniref:restriction endonuclease subunit S n=1 Tax=Streptobacillus moniliformis TaxID=34105 RepID=UPI0007E397D7|nr:restriction endonuclease subunit S [Streptobacillus moniliformis]
MIKRMKLIDVFSIDYNNGKGFTKKDYVSRGYCGALHSGNIGRNTEITLEEPKTFINCSVYSENVKAYKNEIIVKIEDFGLDYLLKAVLYKGEVPIAVTPKTLILETYGQFIDLIDLEYIVIQLNYSKRIREFVKKHATGTKVMRISKASLKELEIDIPPLEEQKRIATIYKTWSISIENLGKNKELTQEYKNKYIGDLFK